MKLLGIGLVVVLSFAFAACGGSETKIDTPTVLSVFRQTGFRNLSVFSSETAARESAQAARKYGIPQLARPPFDADVIYTRGFRLRDEVLMPLSAGRFPSSGTARKRMKNDKPLVQGKLSRLDRQTLPPSFDVKRLTEVRVCNLVVTSYNAKDGRLLQARFRHALALLRKKC